MVRSNLWNVTATRAETRRVLLVCTGNTCRSPLAAALLQQLRPEWQIRSAGVSAGGGAPASAGSRSVARERGLSLEEHRATPLDEDLVDWADTIACMTEGHRRALLARYPRAAGRAELLRKLAGFNPPFDIEDPFGGPTEAYRACADELEAALRSWSDAERA